MKDIRRFWDDMSMFGPNASVIDPKDRLGYKNNYITYLRDKAILNALSGSTPYARILDFGCGSGNLSKTLADNDYCPVGVDISFEMLKYTQCHKFSSGSLFVQYDGKALPFSANSFDACVTYGVLIYLPGTDSFCRALKEINRVMRPGGRLVFVEQTASLRKRNSLKIQRSTQEILKLIEASGFLTRSARIIRRGHFPLIYLVRYGFVPSVLYDYLVKIEAFFGGIFSRTLLDYADTIFMAEKPLD